MNNDSICDVTFINGTMVFDERPSENKTIADREFTNEEIKKSLEWLDESNPGTAAEDSLKTDEIVGQETDSEDVDVGELDEEPATSGGSSDNGDDKPNPYCDKFEEIGDWPDSGCHDRKDYYDGGPKDGLYPCNDGTDKEDWRDCKDASGYDYDNDDSRDEEDTGGSNPRGEEDDQSCGGESCSDDEKEDSTTDEDVEEDE